jgi:hypothetical protein
MSSAETRYRVCAPKVIHETLDDETVVVNLDTGTYYSLDKTGRATWLAFAAGATETEVVAHLAASYSGDLEAMARETRDLLAELLADGLLEAVNGLDGPAPLPVVPGRPGFVKPRLAKHTDMQELILLDPVHEVDAAAGWPVAKPAA